MVAVGVCGFGRCGSTMLMQMLAAGGVPWAPGSAPGSGELPDARAAWSIDLDGSAVKLLDVVRLYGLPPAPAWRFVWLDRNPVQQARSHTKFLRGLRQPVPPGTERRFAASYTRDRSRTLQRLRAGGPVLVMAYERVLADPGGAAVRLGDWLQWPGFDAAAAAGAVHRRRSACRPDLSVEILSHRTDIECDWGHCSDRAVAVRYGVGDEALPVCDRHRADAREVVA